MDSFTASAAVAAAAVSKQWQHLATRFGPIGGRVIYMGPTVLNGLINGFHWGCLPLLIGTSTSIYNGTNGLIFLWVFTGVMNHPLYISGVFFLLPW